VCLSVSRVAKVISPFLETWCYDWAYQSKNPLTFGNDPVPDADSGSLFHLPRHCRRAFYVDLLAFLMQSPADFH